MSTRPTTTFPTQTIPDGSSSYVIRPLTTIFVPPPECPDLISEDFDTTSRSRPLRTSKLSMLGRRRVDRHLRPRKLHPVRARVPNPVGGVGPHLPRNPPHVPGVTPWTSAEAVTGPTSDVTGGDNNGGDTGGDTGGDDGGKSGLSSGAIAGIAVGALAGVLAIVGIAVFVWWRKRKSAQGHVPVPQGPPPPVFPRWPAASVPGHYGGTPVSNQQHLPGMPGAAGFPNPNADPRYSYMGAPGPNGYSPQPQQLAYGAVPPNGASPDMISSQGTTPQPGVVAGGYPVQQQQVPPVHHFEMDGTSAQPPPPAELSSEAPPL
ncbi:unnamed protein product [Parascedosporium putredinis]|uniref:Uncharacterized protein n=1 Tax=Parascedosporium putredinis TaxID=1442378 RepID=A0A9P1GYS6_9PEZI|nr:unnamed protein product [Parascedosporium putredinis]CAI7990247.1 unnamed protein product [Parascedosporium putredinis]